MADIVRLWQNSGACGLISTDPKALALKAQELRAEGMFVSTRTAHVHTDWFGIEHWDHWIKLCNELPIGIR